ncbi:hypothetical protein DFH07DRAFT_1020184, partial [Mycena maculata]
GRVKRQGKVLNPHPTRRDGRGGRPVARPVPSRFREEEKRSSTRRPLPSRQRVAALISSPPMFFVLFIVLPVMGILNPHLELRSMPPLGAYIILFVVRFQTPLHSHFLSFIWALFHYLNRQPSFKYFSSATMFGRSAHTRPFSSSSPHHFIASLKKAVAKKTAKKHPPFDAVAYFAQFEDDTQTEKAGRAWRPRQHIPEVWPSKYHHKCDIEWCEFPNPPCAVPGDHRCGFYGCFGNFHVTPELATAVAINNERLARKKAARQAIESIPLGDREFLQNTGMSAMHTRKSYAPSQRSVATAPAFIQFPRDPTRVFIPNTHTLPSRREYRPRPSLPSHSRAVEPSQRHPSQPVPP